MTKHTPGPWEVGDESKGESPRMVYCDDSLGSRVADCSTAGHGIPTAAERANALLIAAAPQLLLSLKELFATMEPEIGGSPGSILERARAAIAKAEPSC